jgi:hypothetical protein
MAAVALLEAAAVIALMAGGFLVYRRLVRLIAGIEERQIAPVVSRVNAILDDIKGLSRFAHLAASLFRGGSAPGA